MIMDSMREHLCRKIEVNEVTFNEIAKRTKTFFFDFILRVIVDQYCIAFHNIIEHLYKYYRVVLLLEEEEFIDDMI